MNSTPVETAAALLGATLVGQSAVPGGYTHALRRIAHLSDNRSVFVKAATDDSTARWLRAEHVCYTAFAGQEFMARELAWHDGERPVLVLEDLSGAHWPTPWRPGDVDAVMGSLELLRAVEVPPTLPSLAENRGLFESWEVVANDRAPFLSLGMADNSWLDACLPALLDASSAVEFDGDSVVHLDVRSDNLALGEHAFLVDWNWARRGNPDIDLAFWLPSLAAEGGPSPDTLMPGAGEYAALVSGFFAAKAGVPLLPPRTAAIKSLQISQLMTSLPWACAELGLPLPALQNAAT